jgi:hypothetical protein
MTRKTIGISLLVLLLSLTGVSLRAQTTPERYFYGTWGTGTTQIGLWPAAPDMLPQGPFMGPGGFRVDTDGAVWISDSVQRQIKRFHQGNVTTIPVPALKLGDLAVSATRVAVCTVEPTGVMLFDKKSGKEIRRHAIALKTPGRLLMTPTHALAIEETGSGLWLIASGSAPERHPAAALEPVGDDLQLFGMLYDFEDSSRKVIRAGWAGETSEPSLFAFFRAPGTRIVFCRTLALIDQLPLAVFVTADSPGEMRFVQFSADGTVAGERRAPIFPCCYLPSTVIANHDGTIFLMKADMKGFEIFRLPR